MSDLTKRFGKLVAAHRRRQGMSQRQLAEAASLSDDMISRIETGLSGATFPTLERLSTALDVDPAELFGAEPSKEGQRGRLRAMIHKLAGLPDRELAWAERILDAALDRP